MRYRLLGYYHYPKQDMGAERNFVENAAKLALAFEKALQGILDDDRTEEELKSVIRDDTVFIFKDEDGNLYGYFTKNKTARISGVVFDKRAITQVSLKYKRWFYLGQSIRLIVESDEDADKIIEETRTKQTKAMTQKLNYMKDAICSYIKEMKGWIMLALLMTSGTTCMILALIPIRSYMGEMEEWLTKYHDNYSTTLYVVAITSTLTFWYLYLTRKKHK